MIWNCLASSSQYLHFDRNCYLKEPWCWNHSHLSSTRLRKLWCHIGRAFNYIPNKTLPRRRRQMREGTPGPYRRAEDCQKEYRLRNASYHLFNRHQVRLYELTFETSVIFRCYKRVRPSGRPSVGRSFTPSHFRRFRHTLKQELILSTRCSNVVVNYGYFLTNENDV